MAALVPSVPEIRFCNGLRCQSLLSFIASPEACFCPQSAQGRCLMMSAEDRSAHLTRAVNLTELLPDLRPGLIHRPGEGTLLRGADGGAPARRVCRLLLV